MDNAQIENKTPITNETIIQAMEHYFQEYIHRDNTMWSQNYKFFFSSLVVTLLPNLTENLGLSLPEKFASNTYIFPFIGITLAFVFLYVSHESARRFCSVSKTYNSLIKLLPTDLQRREIEENLFSPAYVISLMMFVSLIFIAIMVLI